MKRFQVWMFLMLALTGAVFAEAHIVGFKGENYLVNGKNTVIIVDLVEDAPAIKSGMRVGDRIIAVNNENMIGKTMQNVAKIIGGDHPKDFAIKVQRGSKIVTLNMSRVPASELSGKSLIFNDGLIIGGGVFMTPVFAVDYTTPKCFPKQMSMTLIDSKNITLYLKIDDNLAKTLWATYYVYQKSTHTVLANDKLLVYRKGEYTNLIYDSYNNKYDLVNGKIKCTIPISDTNIIESDLRLNLILEDGAGNKSIYTMK